MANVWKEYNVCSSEVISEALPLPNEFGGNWFVLNSSYPDWFVPVISPYGGLLFGWKFEAPIVEGTFTITFIDQSEGDKEWEIIIHVSATCSTTVYDNCCYNQYNLTWLNREGGWQNYIFTGVREFKVDIGKDPTYVTSNLELKNSEVEGVYNGVILTTGDVPRAHVDLLDSLQYAIQAFLYNDDTALWDIPILIDKRSFTKYKSNDKFYDVKIRFLFAEQLLIQTQ